MRLVVWVSVLHISPATLEKLNAKHGLTADDVRHAVERVKGLRADSEDHPDYGYRLLLKVTIRNRLHLVVLRPTSDATIFNLASAYPL